MKYQALLKPMFLSLLCLMFFICCKGKIENSLVLDNHNQEDEVEADSPKVIDNEGATILTRFSPPHGFARQEVGSESFASYLRNFPLLDSEEEVHLYNGMLKPDQSVHVAILDIDVGDRDLQQCADAIMRLRAEHLLARKKYDDIAFNFTNGWKFEYQKWRKGNDLVVDGNKTKWKTGAAPKESYDDFRDYMNKVFMYAGTLSLSKELKPKKLEDLEIGDVFIQGGSPGHAVLVVDVAVNETNGDKAFMLAQSYMPAQQIHVLKNAENGKISPWFLLSEIEHVMMTPEWTFRKDNLMKF